MSPVDVRAALSPEALSELAAARWVRLTTLGRFVPFSPQTLRRWAKSGKLPVSKRFGMSGWWVDMKKLRAGGSEVLALFNDDAE
jgi:hypothetical protein